MNQSTLFNIYFDPYVIELVFDNESLSYILPVFLKENDISIIHYQNSYKTHDFTIISCFKQIIDTKVPLDHIVTFHKHRYDDKYACIEHALISNKICGRFVKAYFHMFSHKIKRDLLKYLWVEYLCSNC